MKKAQIQNMESIAVVIIIGILIVLGIVFGFSQKSDKIEKDVREQKDISSLGVALKVAGLKELKCSSFQESGNVCLDVLRLLAFEDIIKPSNQEIYKYYYGFFRDSELIIHLIYPDYFDDGGVQIHNVTVYSSVPDEFEGVQSLFYPILVYDPFEDNNIFGLMEVKTFI